MILPLKYFCVNSCDDRTENILETLNIKNVNFTLRDFRITFQVKAIHIVKHRLLLALADDEKLRSKILACSINL